MHIDEETRTAIHRLWDEMAELPASAPEVCLNKLFTEISPLIDSHHGLWLSSLRLADERVRHDLRAQRRDRRKATD